MSDRAKEKPVVLLVDDEEPILNSTKSLLRRKYKVHTFTNPLEVEEFLETNPVDVIISDELMPEMRGSDLVMRIHRRHPDICKIILSGHSEKENMAKAINEGHIFAFLFKPTDNVQLVQVIDNGIEAKKMKEAIKEKNELLEKHNVHLEKQVEKRTNQIIQMEKFYEVGKFASSIVHNLNNPLQSLIMAFQLLSFELESVETNAKADRYMKIFDENLLNMEKMIKSITSSVRSAAYEKNTPIAINNVIRTTVEYMKINHDFKHNIELKLLLEEDLKEISGQEIHFNQIFSNLLKNAVDAMENIKDKKILIQTENLEDGKIKIVIQDTGCGIPRENLERIFSTDFTTKPVGKGTGLGLPITKQMVESYKGTIEVKSEVDKGTAFIITLCAE